MLNASDIIAFAATVDSVRARAFYEGVLGVEFVFEDEFAVVFDAHGTELRIQKVRSLTPQPYTLLGWSVASITEVATILRSRGVEFEKYAFLSQDQLGVWTAPSGARIAWFKDADGNLLSLTEPPRLGASSP
jgi:catechol 2,3-dioxygenase-like lactoylglutathione lyase family enzyme